MIKATILALASAMLINNAASAQPPPGFEARMDQKYRILQQQADAATRQAEGEYQRNIAEADKTRDAENRRLRKIYLECRASVTEEQAAACFDAHIQAR